VKEEIFMTKIAFSEMTDEKEDKLARIIFDFFDKNSLPNYMIITESLEEYITEKEHFVLFTAIPSGKDHVMIGGKRSEINFRVEL